MAGLSPKAYADDKAAYGSGCGEEIRREENIVDLSLGHDPGEPAKEDLNPAAYETTGSYDEVIYYTRCGAELKRTPRTIPVLTGVPVIITQPQDKTAAAGKTVTFTVEAQSEGLTCQWYCQKKGSAKWVKISKATKASYSFKPKKGQNG